MPQIDYKAVSLRAAAILTTAYVPAVVTVAPANVTQYNQLKLNVAITKGSLTTVELIVEFSDDGTNWYQETDETQSATSNVDTRAVNKVVHQFSVDGNYRLLVPLVDTFVRVSVKGTGTVTSSSVTVTGALVKNFS